ncbi:MAG: phospholipid carrier-dependent glycosyltransferase [Spartobacteria bacterium]|nr:phospholipid carrier-dependent glycosyltransferase [Spartobacteria bacterium]
MGFPLCESVDMLIVLPIIVFVVLACAEWSRQGLFRDAVLRAAVFVGVITVTGTEALGFCRMLTFWGVVGFWGIALMGVGGWCVLTILRHGWGRPASTVLSTVQWALLVWCVVYILLIGLLAWMCPPNVWDGLTYHMSRVMHWIQNRSVAFYPTSIPRQLHLSPGAEYVILHAQLLSGGDRFANLVQWGAMTGCLLAGSLMAHELGAGRRGQLLTVVLVLTLPAGILQASNVQTDFVVSFWLLLLALYVVRMCRQASPRDAFLAGGALGLAVLTKGTALVFAAPLLLVYTASAWRADRKTWLRAMAVMGCLTLLLNGPFWLRNQALYGRPLGPGSEGVGGAFSYRNDHFSADVLLSNLSRNLALHAVQPVSALRMEVEEWTRTFHEALGLDSDDPATTWTGTTFHLADQWAHEVHAGNPLHLLLIFGCGLVLCIPRIFRKNDKTGLIRALYLSGWCGLALFCLLLRWQPWGARLHLPFFVLLMPCLGVVVERIMPPRFAYGLGILLLLCALPWLFSNALRPLVGPAAVWRVDRSAQYFAAAPSLRAPYGALRGYLARRGPEEVGLFLGLDDPEYLLWRTVGAPGMTWRHVGVENASGRLAAGGALPDVILVSRDMGRITLEGRVTKEYDTRSFSPFSVIER